MISCESDCKKSLTKIKRSPEKTIRLPDPSRITPIQPMPIKTKSNDNLAEMCNFDPHIHSFTPPDKYFMQNLRRRMETV
jgi:hypothetical protein